jgi:hypothetical protein
MSSAWKYLIAILVPLLVFGEVSFYCFCWFVFEEKDCCED